MQKQSVCAAKNVFPLTFDLPTYESAIGRKHYDICMTNNPSSTRWAFIVREYFWKYYLCAVKHCIILSYDKLKSKNLNLAVSICPRIIEFPTVSENIKHEYLVTNANSFQNIWLFFFIKKSFPRLLFFLASDLNLRRLIADTRYYAAKHL